MLKKGSSYQKIPFLSCKWFILDYLKICWCLLFTLLMYSSMEQAEYVSLDLSDSLMSVIILYSDLEESRRILLGSEDEEDEPAVSLQVIQMAPSCFT
jgi:hypothetical protein